MRRSDKRRVTFLRPAELFFMQKKARGEDFQAGQALRVRVVCVEGRVPQRVPYQFRFSSGAHDACDGWRNFADKCMFFTCSGGWSCHTVNFGACRAPPPPRSADVTSVQPSVKYLRELEGCSGGGSGRLVLTGAECDCHGVPCDLRVCAVSAL